MLTPAMATSCRAPFSRPVPEDEFVRWVRANAALTGD